MKTFNIILAVMMIILFKMNGMSQTVIPNDKATSVVSTVSEVTKNSTTIYCKDTNIELKRNQIDCMAILEDGIIQDENSFNNKSTNQTVSKGKKIDMPEISIVFEKK